MTGQKHIVKPEDQDFRPKGNGMDEMSCSQSVVMRAVFESITAEMTAMERMESKAAEDRHWSLADAMKNKRLAYGSALGFAMRGIEQAFSSANAAMDLPGDPNGPKTNSDVAAG
jgi:hypothetical protein